MTRDEFFEQVEVILGRQAPGQTGGRENWHKGIEHGVGRGRWHRGAGAGRFPGYGVIRYYSPSNIHVMLHRPTLSETFSDPFEALKKIAKLALAY